MHGLLCQVGSQKSTKSVFANADALMCLSNGGVPFPSRVSNIRLAMPVLLKLLLSAAGRLRVALLDLAWQDSQQVPMRFDEAVGHGMLVVAVEAVPCPVCCTGSIILGAR